MKSRLLVLSALAAVVLLSINVAWSAEGVYVYHTERGRFSISVPSAWQMQEQDMGQGIWGVFAQSQEESSSDPFFENVNIMVVPADTANLSEANSRGIDVLKKNMTQFVLLDQAVGKIGQHETAWIVHTFLYEGHTLKVIKFTLLNGPKGYLITCTALPETFEKFRPIFDSIVASIAFDEPATPRTSPATTQARSDGNSFNVASKLGGVIGAIVGFYALFRALRRKK